MTDRIEACVRAMQVSRRTPTVDEVEGLYELYREYYGGLAPYTNGLADGRPPLVELLDGSWSLQRLYRLLENPERSMFRGSDLWSEADVLSRIGVDDLRVARRYLAWAALYVLRAEATIPTFERPYAVV